MEENEPTDTRAPDNATVASEGVDGEFGLPPAPTIPPENVADWPALRHPGLVGSSELVILGRLEFLARQNQAIMGMVQNLYSVLSTAQSRRSSISSTSGSDAGDSVDLTLDSEAGQRVTEAFNMLKSEPFHQALVQFHDTFVQIHKKKLYVMRNVRSSRDAKEFATYVVNEITEKQAEPQGQPDTDLVEQQGAIVSHLQSITPDLETDLYILLNKNKKQNDGGAEPKSKGKAKRGKAKGKGKGRAKNTREDDEEGMDEEDLEGDHDQQLTAAGGPMSSRQQSEAHSHGSGGSRRSSRIAQNREISASSALDASQHSQHSNTTIQRRRSKQRTRFAEDIEDSDLE